MTTFLDTNALIYLSNPDEPHHAWAVEQLAIQKGVGPVIVPDVVYAEFAFAFDSQNEVDAVIEALELVRVSCTNRELFRASRAFKIYKEERSGPKECFIPDFFVGAAAEAAGAVLMTNDRKKIASYFPRLQRIQP